MPRRGRKKSKTGIYHIVLRGINRQTIFEDKQDAIRFLETMKKYKEVSGYKIYAYCLMSNHIHLLLKEELEELGVIMRRIGASYVYWYNKKYNRCGHLFQGRFQSEVVENDQYLLTVLRYIHQNPIKAKIVNNIEHYKWSSYFEYLQTNTIVDTNFMLNLFGNDRKKAIDVFKQFHRIENNDMCLDIQDNRSLTDEEAIEIIKKTCNINQCNQIQAAEREQRDKYLRLLKKEGISTRHIARLTGISRGVVQKA